LCSPAARADRARLVASSWFPYRAWPPARRCRYWLAGALPPGLTNHVCPPRSSTSSILMTPRTARTVYVICLIASASYSCSRLTYGLKSHPPSVSSHSDAAPQPCPTELCQLFLHRGAATGNIIRPSKLGKDLLDGPTGTGNRRVAPAEAPTESYQSRCQGAPVTCALHWLPPEAWMTVSSRTASTAKVTKNRINHCHDSIC
jgi:hypothetical protein